MILNHFSSEPFDLDYSRQYKESSFKPNGLWLCEGDEWWAVAISGLRSAEEMKYKTSFKVDISDVVILTNKQEIIEFHKKYKVNNSPIPFPDLLNWEAVKKDYNGILITPYNKIPILTEGYCSWHAAWDLSGGCIWNMHCLEKIDCQLVEAWKK